MEAILAFLMERAHPAVALPRAVHQARLPAALLKPRLYGYQRRG